MTASVTERTRGRCGRPHGGCPQEMHGKLGCLLTSRSELLADLGAVRRAEARPQLPKHGAT